jgi:hypothetical protein
VSLEEIKNEVVAMPEAQQDQLAAYLVHLRHRRDPEVRKDISTKNGSRDPAQWLSLDELKRSGTESGRA